MSEWQPIETALREQRRRGKNNPYMILAGRQSDGRIDYGYLWEGFGGRLTLINSYSEGEGIGAIDDPTHFYYPQLPPLPAPPIGEK